MAQLFEIGRSALRSYQTALNVVGQNLANAETPGYARQRVEFAARNQISGAGAGVNVSRIERLSDQFAQLALRDAVAERSASQVRAEVLGRLDAVLSDDATGLAEPLRNLLTASSALTANPTDIPTRQQFLAATEAIADRVNGLNNLIGAEMGAARQELSLQIEGINSDLNEIAQIERNLALSVDNTDTSSSNLALLDRRDQLLDGLAETLGLNGQLGSDGMLRVSLQNGQSVLSGGLSSPIGLTTDVYGQPRLTVAGLAVSDEAIGGRLGGIVSLLAEDLPAAQDQLAQLAAAISLTANAAQQQGVDLNGNTGGALFSTPVPVFTASSANTGLASLSGQITDLASLSAQRFELRLDTGVWTANLENGLSLPIIGTGTVADPLQVAGLSLTISGLPQNGDRYLVRAASADGFSAAMLNPDQLATAAAGSGPGSTDNTNAVALFDNLSSGLLENGQRSIQDANINWIAQTGGAARADDIRANNALALEQGAILRREQAQGVSLDEEAADLLRFEQAYSAAAQILATADSLFETLLSAVRR